MSIPACLNYIGSKKKLLTSIDKIVLSINNEIKSTKPLHFLDGFAGSGIVGKYFNTKYKYRITSNDLEYYSYILNYANLKINYSDRMAELISSMDILSSTMNENYNLITREYSLEGKDKRMFWTVENTKKADAIMCYIDEHNLTSDEKIFIVASLITSLDKVANTTSVYGAYLKHFKKSAMNVFKLMPIHTLTDIKNIDTNCIYNQNINSKEIYRGKYDIVYLDPPYNERQYGSNYHPLNYIARYDINIETYGKTGLIKNYNKSNYCYKNKAIEDFTELIDNLCTKYILVSYNNEGIIPQEDFIKILCRKGNVTLYKIKYKKFKSSDKQEDCTTYEYLYKCVVKMDDSIHSIIPFTEIIIDV